MSLVSQSISIVQLKPSNQSSPISIAILTLQKSINRSKRSKVSSILLVSISSCIEFDSQILKEYNSTVLIFYCTILGIHSFHISHREFICIEFNFKFDVVGKTKKGIQIQKSSRYNSNGRMLIRPVCQSLSIYYIVPAPTQRGIMKLLQF